MKQWKHIELNERRKHQFTYFSLLLAAVFLAAIRQVGWWLAIAIAVGIAADEVFYQIAKRKAGRGKQEPGSEKPENLPEDSGKAEGPGAAAGKVPRE